MQQQRAAAPGPSAPGGQAAANAHSFTCEVRFWGPQLGFRGQDPMAPPPGGQAAALLHLCSVSTKKVIGF